MSYPTCIVRNRWRYAEHLLPQMGSLTRCLADAGFAIARHFGQRLRKRHRHLV